MKPPQSSLVHSLLIATLASLMLLDCTVAKAADYSFVPSLAVNEEYTDNVFETNLNKRSDYITRLLPGLAFKYKAPLWDWDLNYNFDYRIYARKSRGDESTHLANGKALVKLVDEKLFLEASDTYQKVSLDVTRDTTGESLFVNQSDQNIATVSPYLVLHPTLRLTMKSGYRYINTWYRDPAAISKQDHVGFIENSYELSPKLFLTGSYTFTREIATGSSTLVTGKTFSNNLYRHEAYLGPRYEYADKSFIFAQGGVIITKYDSRQESVNPSWNAGLTHTFDTLTATLATGVTYSNDPLGVSTLETSYSASLSKTMQRGTLSLQGSYSEFTDTTADKLKIKRYSGGFTSGYEVIDSLHANLGLTYEYYQDVQLNGITRKYFVDSGLNYSFGKDLSAGLSYKYIYYSSGQILGDNKRVNRVILDVKKSF